MADLDYLSKNSKTIISNKQIIYFFNSYFIKHITNTFEKFKEYTNSTEIIKYACNVFFNVFWIEFYTSFNIFQSLFIAEKSIVLYCEFIILSYNSKLIVNENYRPTLIDAVIFTYKKTIENNKINEIKYKKSKIEIVKCSYFLKEIVILLYSADINPKQINTILDKIKEKYYSFDSKEGAVWVYRLLDQYNL